MPNEKKKKKAYNCHRLSRILNRVKLLIRSYPVKKIQTSIGEEKSGPKTNKMPDSSTEFEHFKCYCECCFEHFKCNCECCLTKKKNSFIKIITHLCKSNISC